MSKKHCICSPNSKNEDLSEPSAQNSNYYAQSKQFADNFRYDCNLIRVGLIGKKLLESNCKILVTLMYSIHYPDFQ